MSRFPERRQAVSLRKPASLIAADCSFVDLDYNSVTDLPVDVFDRLIRILDACARYRVYRSITTNRTVM
ncbi:MAG: hypothetical protein ABMA15_02470 [Vicinamibacterales bacterium]